MPASVHSRSKLLTLLALAPGLIALLVACEVATPTPSPTPTPTPTPVSDPISDLNSDSTFGDLASLLPTEAVRCVSEELGVAEYDGLLLQPVFADGFLFGGDFPIPCFTTGIFVSVLIATLSESAEGLSDTTTACIRETFAGLNVKNFAGLTAEQVGPRNLAAATGASMGLLLCLNDEEAEQITAGRLFGDVGGASRLSMAGLRCVLEFVDVGALFVLFDTIESGGAPDISGAISLLTAIDQCNVDLSALDLS